MDKWSFTLNSKTDFYEWILSLYALLVFSSIILPEKDKQWNK